MRWTRRRSSAAATGLFFTQLEDDALHQSYVLTQNTTITLPNNGRADFGLNPFGGAKPTYEQVLAKACDVVGLPFNSPNCYPRSIGNGSEVPFGAHDTSYSHMASIGVQRQFGPTIGIDTNFVFTGGRAEERRQNANSSINPATGANYPATGPTTDLAHLPFPTWGPIAAEIMTGHSNYTGWENTFTKRFSNRWQMNATYTLAWFHDDGTVGGLTGPYVTQLDPTADITTTLVPYTGTIAPDMGPLYQLGSTDQRHRSTVNAIWDMGKGFQLSGLYFFGSGERRGTNWGADLRNTGGANYGILTPAGTTAASLGAVCGCTVKGQTLARRLVPGRSSAVRGQADPSRGPESPQEVRPWRPSPARGHRRGVQRLQSRELRVVHDHVQQRRQLRQAVVQFVDGVPGPLAAAGRALHVLKKNVGESETGERGKVKAFPLFLCTVSFLSAPPARRRDR